LPLRFAAHSENEIGRWIEQETSKVNERNLEGRGMQVLYRERVRIEDYGQDGIGFL